MNVLVVGGAGYIGSHTAKRFAADGHTTVIYDNFSRGHREVAGIIGIPAVAGDLHDRELLVRTLHEHAIDSVVHFAAYASVGESVHDPLTYHDNNVSGTIALLAAMRASRVNRLVFSSTCAVYGEPERTPIHESNGKNPLSPYGRSKWMVEEILYDLHRHPGAFPGFNFAALRYFNAAGASLDNTLGEYHEPETHLIPLVLRALDGGAPITVFGTDYPTPDGTAIRDYIHVEDLARAHVMAVEKLGDEPVRCNLGTGNGLSVKTIIDVAERVTGRRANVVYGPRRAGDPAALFADATEAERALGWRPLHSTPEVILRTAWAWQRSHPHGYRHDPAR